MNSSDSVWKQEHGHTWGGGWDALDSKGNKAKGVHFDSDVEQFTDTSDEAVMRISILLQV